MPKIKSVPFSRYHKFIVASALYSAKPKATNDIFIDRQVMNTWMEMCVKVGENIREQGGEFEMSRWMDICYGRK